METILENWLKIPLLFSCLCYSLFPNHILFFYQSIFQQNTTCAHLGGRLFEETDVSKLFLTFIFT